MYNLNNPYSLYGYSPVYTSGGFNPYNNLAYNNYVYDQLWLNDTCYRPQNIICNIHLKNEKKKTFESRILFKNSGCYVLKEKNGQEVVVGSLTLKDKNIVNLHADGTFDAFYCLMDCGSGEYTPLAIPYKDFVKRNILQYLSEFPRNEDCPDKYIVMAFYKELPHGDDIKFLQLPMRSGWQDIVDGKTTFASSEIVIPQLSAYYSQDILNRRIIYTAKNLSDAGEALGKLLPAYMKYKLLITVRIASVLLYFYSLVNLQPDQMLVIEPKDEYNANAVIALLDNIGSQRNICYITDTTTQITKEAEGISDGMNIYRDSSYAEDIKKINNGLNCILKNMQLAMINKCKNRTIKAIVSDHPGNISPEFPAYFVSLRDCPYIDNLDELLQAIGEFEYAMIKNLTNSDVSDNLVIHGLKNKFNINKTEFNSDRFMFQKIIMATAKILHSYGVFSLDDVADIHFHLLTQKNEAIDIKNDIVNNFRNVISNLISDEKIGVANQYGQPYFDLTKPMVFIDESDINITMPVIDASILPLMKTTHKRNKLLSSLESCGKLNNKRHYQRTVDVEIAPGDIQSIDVYSISKYFLRPDCRAKVNSIAYDSYLFPKSEFPEGFIPLVKVDGCEKIAGCVITDSTDEAESIYISGKTRSGKTRFLVEQAIIRAKTGTKIIIIDQSGAFSLDELKKHLPDEAVETIFSHFEIAKDGIPINLLSLENCSSLTEKKNRLYSIFSVAAKITGDVQGKVLRKRLSVIAKAIEAGKIHSLPETLRFFDPKDPEQAEIQYRLEEVFEDLDGLNTYNQNWGQFLNSQKNIIVLSTAADGIRKGSFLVDMLLASLYEYKQHDKKSKYMVILDEIEELCKEKDGPINTILRKGAKYRLSMILASQEYSLDKDQLGKLIGNCGMHVFFRPKDGNLTDISKHIKIDMSILADLEQGQCVVHGPLYNKTQEKNKQTTIIGRTHKH